MTNQGIDIEKAVFDYAKLDEIFFLENGLNLQSLLMSYGVPREEYVTLISLRILFNALHVSSPSEFDEPNIKEVPDYNTTIIGSSHGQRLHQRNPVLTKILGKYANADYFILEGDKKDHIPELRYRTGSKPLILGTNPNWNQILDIVIWYVENDATLFPDTDYDTEKVKNDLSKIFHTANSEYISAVVGNFFSFLSQVRDYEVIMPNALKYCQKLDGNKVIVVGSLHSQNIANSLKGENLEKPKDWQQYRKDNFSGLEKAAYTIIKRIIDSH
jgi:hypothetical protein